MILKELSEAIGVSGKEDAVRKIILAAIQDHVTDIRIDPMGNITALKQGTDKNRPRVMIAAHMDEIGFMVTGYDNGGLIRFAAVGGVDDRILPGLRVKIGDDQIPGVILWTPIHLNRDSKVVKISNLRIDIGANSKDAAKAKVNIGDRIAFDSEFVELSETTVRGKAFDDRVGCSLLVDVLQAEPYPVDILVAFTVQEEVGLRGAQVAAQTLNPDVAFALEGTTAHDIPNPAADPDDDDEHNPTCRMGSGPALTVMDRSMITHPRLLRFLRETAEQNNIPYQLKTQLGGGTDAGQMHLAGAGRPAAVISMPCRYIHSPAAILSKVDYQNTLKLIQAALHHITFEVLR
ncbi:MAG: peptidase M42 [Phototrophicales bacterium]|nr:MAG: peptidase M42 [Phototrophicales bacterium]RMG72354.1 MAG: M42 family peptidase [Chloroflexota bacterium]